MQAIPARCDARASGDANARRYAGFHARLDTGGGNSRFNTARGNSRLDTGGFDAGADNTGGFDTAGIDARSERNAGRARRLRKSRPEGPSSDRRWR